MRTSRGKLTVLGLAACALFFCQNAHAEKNIAFENNITSIHPQEMREIVLLHRKADEMILKNDFRGAIRTFSDILLVEPDDETAYTGMGQAYMVLGDYERAKSAFQNALHIDPDNDTAAFSLQKIMDPDGVAGMVRVHGDEVEETPGPVLSQEEESTPALSVEEEPVSAPSPVALPLHLERRPFAGPEKIYPAMPVTIPLRKISSVPIFLRSAPSDLADQPLQPRAILLTLEIGLPPGSEEFTPAKLGQLPPRPANFAGPASAMDAQLTPTPKKILPVDLRQAPRDLRNRSLPPQSALLTLKQRPSAKAEQFLPTALASIAPKPEPTPSLPLTPRNIQLALKKNWLYTGAIDENLESAASQKAIRSFQLEHHLKIDGKVGAKTWAKLERFLE